MARKSTPKRKQPHDIPRATFRRIVSELVGDLNPELRVSQEAVDALQEESEKVLEERFDRSRALLDLCKVETLRPQQFRLAESAAA